MEGSASTIGSLVISGAYRGRSCASRSACCATFAASACASVVRCHEADQRVRNYLLLGPGDLAGRWAPRTPWHPWGRRSTAAAHVPEGPKGGGGRALPLSTSTTVLAT